MREMIVVVSCDCCYDQNEVKTNASAELRVQLYGSTRTLDVCGQHEHIADKLAELLADHGSKPTEADLRRPSRSSAYPDPSMAKAVKTVKATHEKVVPPEVAPGLRWPSQERMQCPFCDTQPRKSNAEAHIKSVHGKNVEWPEKTTRCPDCGEPFAKPSSTSLHRVSKHGFDAIADTIARVKAGVPS